MRIVAMMGAFILAIVGQQVRIDNGEWFNKMVNQARETPRFQASFQYCTEVIYRVNKLCCSW